MQKTTKLEAQIVKECARRLQDIGLKATYGHDHAKAADGWLEVEAEGHKHRFLVEVKGFLHLKRKWSYPKHLIMFGDANLICAQHIPPDLANRLKKQKIQYVDMTGNMFIARPGLFLYVEGRQPPKAKPTADTIRVFNATGLRMIFLLLKQPEAVNWTQRKIAMATGIAQGNIPRFFNDLERQGFVVRVRERERQLTALRPLLQRWEAGYAERLRKKLILGRYRQVGGTVGIGKIADELRQLHQEPHNAWEGGVMLGGELGAAILHPNMLMNPATATLHVPFEDEENDKAKLGALLAKCRLAPDRNGNVTILRRMLGMDGYDAGEITAKIALADPLLLYTETDLAQDREDERLLELQERLLEENIYPRFAGENHE